MSLGHHLETIALHEGFCMDNTHSRGIPVHRTTAYMFDSTEHAADLFALRKPGNIYARMMNPTQEVLEKRVAALEGGEAALAVASGTSAIFYTAINICEHGDEIVSTINLYGGTFTMFNDILPQFGIKTRFSKSLDPKDIESQITEKTRLIYTEVIGNPTLDVADIEEMACIAKKHQIPLVVDSTFTTPYLFRPLDHGADIVVHSLTKWLGGHGAVVGGIVVDSGKFDWKNEKFGLYNKPDPSYHDLRYAHDIDKSNGTPFICRMRLVLLRNLGACISPDNAWLFLMGIETFSLRMQRHCDNAFIIAKFLKAHEMVEWIRYPGLEDDPGYPVASRQLKNGFGGMVVFGVKGGYKSGKKFIDNLKLVSHLASVGDSRSLAVHPSSTTHSQLDREQQLAGGITEDMIRLSVGIEHVDDIRSDLQNALSACKESL